MPSTYTLNNGIELIATGEQSGTWGDTTNTNLSLVDTALDGQVTVTLPSAGTSGSPNTLAISDGAASDGRNRMVIFNDGGDLGATAYVQLTPNDAEKIIYVRNDLAGSRSIILFQGTYNASNDYELPAGTTAVIYFDGAGSGAVAANVFNNAYFDSLRLGSVSVTAILDEDDMSSDSATALATQQSIKAYVDTQITAEDLDFAGDSGTGAVDLDSQTFTIAGTANEIETSASGQTLTIGLPDDVTIAGDLTVDTDTLYVDSTNNRVGIGDATPSATLNVLNDSGGANTWTNAASAIIINEADASSPASIKFGPTTVSEGGQIVWGGAGGDGPFVLRNYNLIRLKIDADGRVLIGAEDSVSVSSSSASGVQVAGTSASSWLSQLRYNNGASGPLLNLGKTRSATIGTVGTIVQDDDTIGTISFAADDGVDVQTQTARIQANVDGTPGANDMPGRLTFWTTADGASSVTERMRITSSGSVGIGTTPTEKLHVADASATVFYYGDKTSGSTAGIALSDAVGSSQVLNTDGELRFKVGGNASTAGTSSAEAMRIDTSQRVLIGLTSSANVASVTDADLQIETTGIGAAIVSNAGAAGPAGVLALGHKRGAGGVVSADDALGDIRFAGHDGTDLESQAGQIRVSVDGTPGSNDMPGRLQFYTTADGNSSPTERMRISEDGTVSIGYAGSHPSILRLRQEIDTSANTATGVLSLQGGASTYTSFLGMDATGLSIGLTSTSRNLRFVTNSSTAMTIDTSQRVLIGLTSARTVSTVPQVQIEGTDAASTAMSVTRNSTVGSSPSFRFVATGGSTIGSVTAVADNANLGNIYFLGADGNDTNSFAADIGAQVDGTPGSNDMPGRIVFRTTADGAASPTERARIDSTGKLMIGKTDTGINVAGHRFDPDGSAQHVVDNENPLYLNRKTSNGNLIQFYRDGTLRGQVGVADTDILYIGSSDGLGIKFNSDNSRIDMCNASGVSLDASADIGGSSSRIRRLYLSDGIVFDDSGGSGTVTSRTLDDYEEGNWTPDVTFGGSNTGITYVNVEGRYTKVGRLVTVFGRIGLSDNGSATGAMAIAGLPFAVADVMSTTSVQGSTAMGYVDGTAGTQYGFIIMGWENTSEIRVFRVTNTNGDSQSDATNSNILNNFDCRFTCTYMAAS